MPSIKATPLKYGFKMARAIETTTSMRRRRKPSAMLLFSVFLLQLLSESKCCDAFSSSKSLRVSLRQQYRIETRQSTATTCYGWLETFFEPQKADSSSSREVQYPEQYLAVYEVNEAQVKEDEGAVPEVAIARPLLKNTQLESRPLQLVYDANKDGWNPSAFHQAVDGKGASVVIVETVDGKTCGGYNPKGWASLGGARPSVAAFLFYERAPGRYQKLQKVGGGGLACAQDDPNFGISFGPDGLVIGLQSSRERIAQSKLGPYFERGPQDLPSLFGGAAELKSLKVLVGCYEEGEEIPYSGGVLDMTSG